MRRLLYAAAVLGLVGTQSAGAVAQESESFEIQEGAFTGQTCHEVDGVAKAFYMAGVVDGIHLSPFLGAPDERSRRLTQCLGGSVTPKQLAAMLEKWLNENPERWHESCYLAAFSVLVKLCGTELLWDSR